IYYNEVSVEPPNRAVLTCNKDLRITFILPDDYPDRSTPELEISAPSLSAAEKRRIHSALQRVFKEHPGEPVLYYAIDAALQMQRDPTSFADENDTPEGAKGTAEWTEDDQKALEEEERRRLEEKKASVVHVPETYSGESVEDRKSVFQAHVARIKSKEEASVRFSPICNCSFQAMAVLAKLKENSKIARATHNMYAWVTTTEKNGKSFELHDCEDDGENAAGAKLLNLLSLMQIRDVIVVVTRWYGGIHLGPDRFRHIASAARQALVDGGFARNAK
ncbi:impact family protein, partial [Aphelenchoides avenae]